MPESSSSPLPSARALGAPEGAGTRFFESLDRRRYVVSLIPGKREQDEAGSIGIQGRTNPPFRHRSRLRNQRCRAYESNGGGVGKNSSKWVERGGANGLPPSSDALLPGSRYCRMVLLNLIRVPRFGKQQFGSLSGEALRKPCASWQRRIRRPSRVWFVKFR